jgi:hypothetical protein
MDCARPTTHRPRSLLRSDRRAVLSLSQHPSFPCSQACHAHVWRIDASLEHTRHRGPAQLCRTVAPHARFPSSHALCRSLSRRGRGGLVRKRQVLPTRTWTSMLLLARRKLVSHAAGTPSRGTGGGIGPRTLRRSKASRQCVHQQGRFFRSQERDGGLTNKDGSRQRRSSGTVGSAAAAAAARH